LSEEYERKSTPFRPPKLPPLSILYNGVSRGVSRGVFRSPIQRLCADRGGVRGLRRQGPLFRSASFWNGFEFGLPIVSVHSFAPRVLFAIAMRYRERMIRDLQYPEDARKTLASLCDGLTYDAAIAVTGIALSKIPLPQDAPDFAVPIRCGGLEQDKAVRRDAPILLSRFSLISMISRFEVHAQNLLLQRRVLEYLKVPEKKMDGPSFWKILTRVQSESRSGPLRMCDGLVVTQPSAALKKQIEWLDGLYRVRNCLAHRLGLVQMIIGADDNRC